MSELPQTKPTTMAMGLGGLFHNPEGFGGGVHNYQSDGFTEERLENLQ